LGLDHRSGHLPPGVETPGYYPPFIQDEKSPMGATDNSPVIYCRVASPTSHYYILASAISDSFPINITPISKNNKVMNSKKHMYVLTYADWCLFCIPVLLIRMKNHDQN